MSLIKTVRKVQYQTAKIEVLELLFWHGKASQPSLETELAHSMFSTFRQKLFCDSEACLDAPSNSSLILALQNTIVGVHNFLVQMNSGLTSTETQVLFLKKLLTSIASELVGLNTELYCALQVSQEPLSFGLLYDDTENNIAGTNPDLQSATTPPTSSQVDQLFKDLMNKCMGNSQQAERLVQYEQQRNPLLIREEAVHAAIIRWESDNR
ncbi:MAG: hypothetical protein HC827_12180 [Cyanobacteria bacterium RM1_2_2]|nr:hypothetical protein [Cyanobacteria bacterium RM1_2_2]